VGVSDGVIEPESLLGEPAGTRAWLPMLGESMSPLLEPGDVLHVERCEEDGLAVGDVGVVRNEGGMFIAHLVRATSPIETCSWRGRADAGPLTVVGRVIAVRRGDRTLPLPKASRRLVWLAFHSHGWLSRASVALPLRWAAHRVRESRARLALQQWRLKPISVRLLNFADIDAMTVFASGHLAVPSSFLRKQLRTRWGNQGAAAGAFDKRERLIGFAYLDSFREEGLELDDWWVRCLFVKPEARGMEVGRRIVACLCEEALLHGVEVVRADIPADNEASQRLFKSQAFVPSSPAMVELVTFEWSRNGVDDRWVAVERRLAPSVARAG
jgi:L-amino acid N-acyltransferase YncA